MNTLGLTGSVLTLMATVAGAQPPAPASPAAEPADPNVAEVHRLVAAGTPAEAQARARSLVEADTKDPIAWAVVAAAEADKSLVAAIDKAARAGELNDRDPFVQQVAGDLIGRFDGAKPKVPDRSRAQMNTLGHNMRGEAAYDNAYRAARANAEAETKAAAQAAEAAAAAAAPPPIEIEWPDSTFENVVVVEPTPFEVHVETPPRTSTLIRAPEWVDLSVYRPSRSFNTNTNRDRNERAGKPGRFYYEIGPDGRRVPPRLPSFTTTTPSGSIFIPRGPRVHITQRATITRPLPIPPARNESPFDQDDRERVRQRR